MPVKRRRAKRRMLDEAAELAAWREPFSSGFQFDDLADLGIEGDPRTSAVARVAAAEAWQRLGAAFLEGWEPQYRLPVPWALEAFGEPGRVRRAH